MKKGPAKRLIRPPATKRAVSSTEELQDTSRRLTRLIETLQAGILVENEHREIVLVNEMFCRMFDIPAPPDALIGVDCARSAEQSKHLFRDPEGFVTGIDALLKDRTQRTGEILALADGRSFERDYIPIYVDEAYRGHMWVYRDVTQRVRDADELASSQARARATSEVSLNALITIDSHGTVIEWNPAAEATFGFTAKEAIGKTLGELIVPAVHQKGHEAGMKRHRETGVSHILGQRLEMPALRKDGREIEVELTIVPFTASGNQYFSGSLVDITQRKRSEAALRTYADQQQALLDTARAFQSTYAPSQIVRVISEGMSKLFSFNMIAMYVRDEDRRYLRPVLISTHDGITKEPDVWQVPVEQGIVGAVFASGNAENIAHAEQDPRSYYPEGGSPSVEHLLALPVIVGKEIDGIVLLNRFADPPFTRQEFDLAKFLIVLAGLSLQNGRLVEQLTTREVQQRAILEAIPDMIIRFDLEGKIKDLRASEYHALIAIPGQLVGRSLSSVLPNDVVPRALSASREALRTNTLQRMEYDLPRPDGPSTYELRIVPFSEAEVLALSSDISVRKVAERTLLESKQTVEDTLRAKEQFFARMSHEIRTPMNGVIGLTNLLLGTELSEQQQDMLRTLKLSADNLLVIINDILDLAKIEAGHVRINEAPFSLPDLLDSVLTASLPGAEQKGLDLTLSVGDGTPDALVGDAVRLTQVLLNLISNAIKFTQTGSVTLSVWSEAREEGRILLTCEVRDTGMGISQEALPQLFQIFRQFHERKVAGVHGTGLGLAIVRQLTELQGGSVDVESELDHGSTFTVRIPFTETTIDQIVSAPQKGTPALSPLRGIKVLLAEDDAVNQVVATRTLKQWGVDVTVCQHGAEVLETLAKGPFDLVLMDIQMPVMDGFETTRRIRSHQDPAIASIPIIAMTASVLDSAQNRVIDAGMDDYIPKPFDPSVLHDKIRTALHIDASGSRAERPERTSLGLDLSYLVQLAAGDIGFLETMVKLYKDESSLQLAQMKEKARQGRWEDVARAAHKLKPSIEMVGLKELKPRILRLEACGSDAEMRASFDEDFRRVEQRCASSYLELDRIDLSSLLKAPS